MRYGEPIGDDLTRGSDAQQAARSARPTRILVAEPSRTLAALIRASLAELPVELEFASDGAQALSAARQRVPDLLICDERLPGLDGYALAHAMKQLPGERAIHTLLLVPEHSVPDRERLAYVGVSDVLVKPFERAVLLERVRGFLPEPPRLALPEPRAYGLATTPSAPIQTGQIGQTGQSHGPAPAPVEASTWQRFPADRAAEPRAQRVDPAATMAALEPLIDARLATSEAQVEARLRGFEAQAEARIAAMVEQRLAAMVEQRLGPMLTQRLPALVDAALARVVPQLVQAAVDRAVAERVPVAIQAVHDSAQAVLAELTSPAQVEALVADLARDAVTTALGRELMTLVPTALAEVKAHIESELLARLDKFARTELPQKLTSHAEQIVWKVVPTIAEDIVKQEIKRLTAE